MQKRLFVVASVILTALFLQFLQNKWLVGEQDLMAELHPATEQPADAKVYEVVLKDAAGNVAEPRSTDLERVQNRLKGGTRDPEIKVGSVVHDPGARFLRITAPSEVDELALRQRLTGKPYARPNEARDYWHVNLGIDLRGGVEFTCRLRNEDGKVVPADDEVVATMRNRLDERGLTEPVVARLSNGDVQVVIPGGTRADAARTRKVLETTGRLEFREVIADYPNAEFPSTKAGDDHCAWFKTGPNTYKFNPRIAVGSRQDIIAPKDQEAGVASEPTHFLHLGPARLTGKDVADAQGTMHDGQPAVSIQFSAVGAGKNHEFTTQVKEMGPEGLKKGGTGRLAIVFDGMVKSDPRVVEPSSRDCQITGSFTQDQVRDLRGVLRAGSLSVTPEILSERVVGATLGQTEISRAITTMFWTLATMFAFLALYYRRLGLVAICSVLVNGALTWTTLSIFGATLTLPGIAGLILSLAMGIDTNILIYERIREELREDLGVPAAIEAGYNRAFLTVIDSHLTTISAALALYLIGSGPIKGFGLTLMIGIAISLFSGIYFGRLLTDRLLRGLQRVNMASLFKPVHIGYVGLRRVSYTLTILTAIVGVGYFAFGHKLHKNETFERNFDIEFTGGTMVQVSFLEPIDVAGVDAAIAKAWAAVPEEKRGDSLINPREIQKQPYFQSLAETGSSSRQWVFRVRDERGSQFESERHDLDQERVKLLQRITELRDKQPADMAGARKLERDELEPLARRIAEFSRQIAGRTEAFKHELSSAFSGIVEPEGNEIRACTWQPAERRLTMRVATFDAGTQAQAEAIGTRLNQPGRTYTCKADGKTLELSVVFAEAPHQRAALGDVIDSNVARCTALLTSSGTAAADAAVVGAAAGPTYESLVDAAASQKVAVAQPFPASQHFSGQVADRMKFQALLALGIAMGLMMLYIAARFEMAFGLGAVISLLHVVIQTLGVIALIGIRIDLTIVAAFLTIVGYAINDTIVTYDRIRENLGKMAGKPLDHIIDTSIAEVMPRTILTGGHVAVALGIMLIFGGATLQGFCATLLIGIVLGTYSSVFVASALLMTFRSGNTAAAVPAPPTNAVPAQP